MLEAIVPTSKNLLQAKALAKELAPNRNLQVLDLTENLIEDGGARALAKVSQTPFSYRDSGSFSPTGKPGWGKIL